MLAIHTYRTQATSSLHTAKANIKHYRSLITKKNIKAATLQLLTHTAPLFKILGLAAATPAFTVEALINRITQLPSTYTVNSDEELNTLTKPHRHIQHLTLQYTPTQQTTNTLNKLQPTTITSTQPLPLDDLETLTHYYHQHHNSYTLKHKIKNLILPDDINEALHTIQHLTDTHQFIINAYIPTDPSLANPILDTIAPLHPQAIFFTLFPKNTPLLPILLRGNPSP